MLVNTYPRRSQILKRIAVILFLLVVIGFLYTRYVHVAAVNAVGRTNPNFVSKDEMSNVLQTNLNMIWNEFDSVKADVNQTKSDVDEINQRLDAIEQSLTEIQTTLAQ